MKSKLLKKSLNPLKATKMWRNNYIILKEIKHFRWIAVAAVVFTIFSSIFEGLTVSFISAFLQGLINPDEAPIRTGIEWFDTVFLATKATPIARVYRLSGLITVAIVIRSVLAYLGLFYSKLSQAHLLERIHYIIFRQLQRVSLSFYSKSRSGELVNTFTKEVNELKQSFNIISNLVSNSSNMVAYIISMFVISWKLSLIAIAMFTLLSVGLTTIVRQIREASFALPKANSKLSSISLEYINGVRTIQGAASQDFELARFDRAIEESIEANTKLAFLSALVKPIADGVASIILIIMIVVAFTLLIVTGQLKSAELLTFMFVLFRLLPIVSIINQAREKLGRFDGSLSNIKDLLRTDNKPYMIDGKYKFTGLGKGITFNSIDFGYEPNQLILKNVSVFIEKGKTTALVGASGAGKTTLADLIPRFYDADRGEVRIDGIDLKDFEIDSLRNRMAIVSQDTFIFNNTVRYNVAYGLEGIDDRQIWSVLNQANAAEFIQEMPDGLDTVLGDRGTRLSGGQRQRIAIARALLRDPDILILDEATSALDSLTEKQIQKSIEKLSQGRTVIAIAHRLSTIAKADKVVVLDQGRVVEQGTYQELLQQKGKLWEYHRMQNDYKAAV